MIRLPLGLRISGWIVTLAGGVLLFASGGFGPEGRNPLAWSGAIVFVLGMILTASSGVVAQLQRMRALRKASDPPPPSPPAPPALPS